MNVLHRSSTNRIIGGVCGGIAETYSLDVSLIRLLFVIVTLFYGTGLLIYIALLVLLPEDEYYVPLNKEKTENESKQTLYRLRAGKMIAGLCIGIADMLKIDVSIIRVILVIVTLFSSGLPILLYLLLWIIIPYKD